MGKINPEMTFWDVLVAKEAFLDYTTICISHTGCSHQVGYPKG